MTYFSTSFPGSFEKNSVWKLVNTSVTVTSKKYSCCEEPYSLIIFRIHVARRSLFYLLNLIFPISVITLLTILSFLLPAESGNCFFCRIDFSLFRSPIAKTGLYLEICNNQTLSNFQEPYQILLVNKKLRIIKRKLNETEMQNKPN